MVGGAVALAAASNPVAAAGFALVAALVTAVTNDAIDDKIAAEAGTDLSVTKLSDTWGAFKLQMLEAIDLSHSATFSNGFVDNIAGPKVSHTFLNSSPSVIASPVAHYVMQMKDFLQGGAFAGTAVPQAYETSEGNLQGIVQRLMVSKLLESTWRDSCNSFLIYVPNVIGDCQKWRKNTGKNEVLRLCAPTGMFLLHNIDPSSKAFGSPPGATNEDVAKIGDFNIREFSPLLGMCVSNVALHIHAALRKLIR